MLRRNTRTISRHLSFQSQSTQRATNRKLQNDEKVTNIYNKYQQSKGIFEENPNLSSSSSPSSSSLTNLASEYFTNLRLKAVSILSDSLSTNDRNNLLHSLQAIDKSTADDTTKRSIGEAVASALARENVNKEKVWKEKEENVVAMAEQAAMERVKNDLYLIQQKQKENEQQEQQQQQHPVLGNMIADLGHKKLFLTSAKALSAIPVWEKQRIYRHDRAKIMATEKLKKKDDNGATLPGVITLYEDENGQLCILDGQHRVGMMTLLLQQEKPVGFNLNQIVVEVFPHTTSPKELFVEINKAEPIKIVDMPGVAKPTTAKIINDVATKLSQIYPKMFRPSQRCRSPHVNIDNLRDVIFTADIISKYELKNSADLLDWILKKNKDLGDGLKKKIDEDGGGGNSGGKSSAALEKAIKFDFYLGLDSSWLYK